MAMTIVGLVVEINAKDFNVARVERSVDGQHNGNGASFETSVKNLVLGSCGHTSGFHFDIAGQNWR